MYQKNLFYFIFKKLKNHTYIILFYSLKLKIKMCCFDSKSNKNWDNINWAKTLVDELWAVVKNWKVVLKDWLKLVFLTVAN